MTSNMKFVLDTDVVRSGLQSASGASRLLLCGMIEKAFVPLVTVATMIELEDVLCRPECLAATGLSKDGVGAFLDGYIACATQVIVRRFTRPSIQDPSDEIFVEALVNGGGDAIVSFNRRDYLLADDRRASRREFFAPVLSPGEALESLLWRPTAITPFVFPPR